MLKRKHTTLGVLLGGIVLAASAFWAMPALAQAPAASEAASTVPEPPPAPVPSAAPMAPPVPASTVPGAPETRVVENPYGLEALWMQSDLVAKAVLIILLIMSLGTWYILIVKVVAQAKMMRQAKAAADGFWSAGSVQQGTETLATGSPFRFIAEAGVDATRKHEGMLEHVPLSDWVTMSIQRAVDRVQARLQDGLAFLASVGSTAPFIGLFGTVWGIYHALTAIGVAGQASIDKVAGPVGEALIMTAIGLAVAVPAVLGYNWLVRRNKGVMDEVRAFGNDLHSVLLASTPR